MSPPAHAHRSAAVAAALWTGLSLSGCGEDRRDHGGASAPPARAPASAAVAEAAKPSVPAAASATPPTALAVKPGPPPAPASVAPALAAGSLLIPVAGVDPVTLRDNFDEVRGTARHEALDIMAPRGTPVRAVADGRVVKLFTSVPGGLTVYQFDTSQTVAYYYAHLDSYAPGLREGMELRRGDPVGTVGSTGNASADAPHLHFAVFVLGPQRQWWQGTPVNPYPLFAGRR